MFSEVEQQLIRRYGQPCSVAAKTLIFSKGEAGDCMYFIESGEVEVLLGNGKQGKLLGPGSAFGELALLSGDSRRTATVVATRDTLLDRVSHDALEQLAESEPRALMALLRNSCATLIQQEQRHIDALQQRNRELEQTLDYLRRTRAELDASELRANTDELTGLYNRRCFNLQLQQILDSDHADGPGFAVFLIDLDKFKPINDTWGHAAGDTVLISLAETMKTQCRTADMPCRVGGDEFAILARDLTDDIARSMLQRLHRQIARQPVHLPTVDLQITVSIGGALGQAGDNAEALLARADENLYLAKQHGRNLVGWEGRILADAD